MTHLHQCPCCATLWKHGDEMGGVEVAHLCPSCGAGPVWDKWGVVHRLETVGEVLHRLYRSGLLWFVLALWLGACTPKWQVLSNHMGSAAPVPACVRKVWYRCSLTNLSNLGGTWCAMVAGQIRCSSGATTPEEQK